MPFVFVYILKLSVSLAVVFLFYHFVLRRLTFYNWNRWYLLGYTLVSFFIPLIDISPVLQRNEWTGNSIVQWVPVIRQSTTGISGESSGYQFPVWNMISLLILAGMLVMLFRLLVQLVSFYRMMKKADPLAIRMLPGSGMKLFHVNENIIPFSFGNSIFINHQLHTREELREIVWHEFIHVKQRHSLDIICGEILCLLNWFNPFAWLIRHAIRQNLEFIADSKVLESGISRKEYQYLLVKVIGNNHFSIAPKFNFSSLKKRIAMMNKMKSAGVHLVKFLFILPLLAVLLVAFRNNYEKTKHSIPGIAGNLYNDTLPAVPKMPKEIASINLLQSGEETNSTDPLKRKLSGMLVIKRTDGEKEVYDLDKKESRDRFEKKYGVKPEELLPPPPIPPAVPVEGIPAVPPVPPTTPVPPGRPTGGITPVAAESTAGGINLRGISREYEITDKKAVLKLLDGTVEEYNLTNKKERNAFEKKYGKLFQVNTNINTTIAADVNTNINTSVNTNVDSKMDAIITVAPVAIANNAVRPVAANMTGIVTPAASGTTAVLPIAVASSTGVRDVYSYMITGKEDIVITITSKTTRQELEQFKIQMKEKGVDLDFAKIEYNDNGLLVSINGTMKSGGSRSNFVANDFDRLVLAMIKKGDRIYFKVSTRDNKTVI